MITIVPVESSEQQKEFVEFQYQLYQDCPSFVPPFRDDIYLMMNKKKHPFYEHSISDHYLAYEDGKLVGRVAALCNRRFNDYHHTQDAEFYLFDCIDNQEVANALLDRVVLWAKEHGLTRIIGPKGYGVLDGYGIQIEGFEHRQMMNMMVYNYSYYQKLVENYGFVKEVDFVSSYIHLPDFQMPEKVLRACEIVRKRGALRVISFKNKLQILAWKDKIRDAYNNSFQKNWEYYPLTKAELNTLVSNVIMFVLPKMIKLIVNKDNEIVGFVLPFPDMSAAMQLAKGNLGLKDIVHILREMGKTNWIDFNGIGILPEYQGMGGNAIIFEALLASVRENPRFVHAELTQVAETAVQMRKDLANLGAKFYKNHRVYRLELK